MKYCIIIQKLQCIYNVDVIHNVHRLIDHDFISRTDLSPWLCSFYIERDYREKALGSILIDKVKEDAQKEHFKAVYLCTELDGYYEKYDFHYFGVGLYDDGEPAKIYEINLEK